MQVATFHYIQNNWINKGYAIEKTPHAQLLLIFGAKPLIAQEDLYLTLKKEFPKANLVTCSTAGEILDTSSLEDSLVGIAIDFEKTELQFAISNINNHKGSYEMGKALGESLPSQDLRYILLISDGNIVNGDALLKGITEFVPKDLLISGGMAGDGAAFKDTLVGLNGDIQNGNVVLIG
ncbi:MAG: FIST N-terminal domain-containing protein, partial [Ferruginibacter sp.]